MPDAGLEDLAGVSRVARIGKLERLPEESPDAARVIAPRDPG
jgi:hypothetical protein